MSCKYALNQPVGTAVSIACVLAFVYIVYSYISYWLGYALIAAIAAFLAVPSSFYIPKRAPQSGREEYEKFQQVTTSRKFIVKGATIHAFEATPNRSETRPWLLFLHGFPECAVTTWRRALLHFEKLGYHVVAMDLRGFGNSTCEVKDACHAEAVNDVASVIQQVSTERIARRAKAKSQAPKTFGDWVIETEGDVKSSSSQVRLVTSAADVDAPVVVGHDWGGMVAWTFYSLYPEYVRGLCTVSMPHPLIFRRKLTTSISQMLKSYYILFFQVRGVSEWRLSRNDFAPMLNALVPKNAKKHTGFTQEDLYVLQKHWRKQISHMLGYYRNALTRPAKRSEEVKRLTMTDKDQEIKKKELVVKNFKPQHYVTCPLLMIHGKNDVALGYEMCAESMKVFGPNAKKSKALRKSKYGQSDADVFAEAVILDNTSHWVPTEEPNATCTNIEKLLDACA